MKKIISLLTIILFLIMLTGCQPTPDSQPVVYRGEGLPEDCIEPALPDGMLKEIDLPEEWHEDTFEADGWAWVTADVNLNSIKTGNTPIYEYEQKPLSNEDLESLVRYFAGDSKLYKYPELSKAELNLQVEQIKKQNGFYNNPSTNSKAASYYARIDSCLETADDNIEKEYIKPEFDYPTENQYVYFRSGEHQNLAEKEKYYFNALVETNGDYDPQIKSATYNSNAGSSSFFVYQKGAFLSDDDIYGIYSDYIYYKGTENEPIYGASIESQQRIEEYYNDIEKFIDQADDPSDSTKAIVDKTLEDLNITNLSCVDVKKCVALNISPRRWDMSFDKDVASVAYAYTYRISINDNLTCFAPENMRTMTFSDGKTAETVYRPPFGTEQLTILVADDDIYAFYWTNISTKTDTLVENTKILPFEECKERALDHIGYEIANAIGIPPADAKKHWMHYYDATGVDFKYYNVTAYEKPDCVWAVPVYIFSFDTYLPHYDSKGEPDGKGLLGGATVIINALDGGYISLEEENSNVATY